MKNDSKNTADAASPATTAHTQSTIDGSQAASACSSPGASPAGLASGTPRTVEQPCANDPYFTAAVKAARTRAYQASRSARLTPAQYEDLYQDILVDLLEQADRFDPSRGSPGTFTGLLSKHRAAEFINAVLSDRARLRFDVERSAANDEEFDSSSDDPLQGATSLWTEDRDLFADTVALCDLQKAITYMSEEQRSLFDLLQTHQDLPSAARACGMSSATFYRRVSELQMHLRMFGFSTE